MGYIHSIKKDKNVRKNFYKSELKLILLKYNLNLFYLKNNFKYILFFKFIKRFHLSSSYSRLVNKCIITGRSR